MSHGKTLPVSYSRNTVVSILSWLFAFQSCAEHMHHFARCLVTSYLRKLFSLQFAWVFTLSLSHKQPLQLNPTINTGYKRLNKITNKFGIELKPTKQIVVNYNFTILMYVLSPIFTYVVFFLSLYICFFLLVCNLLFLFHTKMPWWVLFKVFQKYRLSKSTYHKLSSCKVFQEFVLG